MASLGDLNGDGVTDLAVGAPGDSTHRGEVYVLLLSPLGIALPGGLRLTASNQATVANNDEFGSSIAVLGDLDADGAIDLTVGAALDDQASGIGANVGTLHVLRLRPNPPGVFGVVFNDLDNDGVRDEPGETGIDGVTVYLDMNDDGVRDANEPMTTTSAGGVYSFSVVTDVQFRDLLPYARRNEFRGPAAFTVRQVVPANAVQSTVGSSLFHVAFPDRIQSYPSRDIGNVFVTGGQKTVVAGQFLVQSGATLDVPIVVTNAAGVDSIGIQLNFDTSVLTLSSFTLGSATSGWLPSFNVSGKKATLVKTGGAALTNTASEVLIVRFTVNAGLADGRSTAIEFVPGATSTVLKIGAATQTFTLLDGAVQIVNPQTLRVETATLTPSGVDLTFNLPVEPASLNLSIGEATAGNGASGATSAADLVLTGPSGPVSGSLDLAADRKSARFVATGGVLADGIYTLTLKSVSTAWKTPTGGLLDGNADGAAGDDFVRQLTRSSSGARTVSLPDFARGPDQIVNLPANAIGIPVTISEAGGVTRIDLELSFDPALLVITAVQAGPDLPVGWTIVPDFSVSGKVSWVATGPALAAGADKSLFVLTASVHSLRRIWRRMYWTGRGWC